MYARKEMKELTELILKEIKEGRLYPYSEIQILTEMLQQLLSETEWVIEIERMHPEDADNILVKKTANLMAERLKAQREKSFYGWNSKNCNNHNLRDRLEMNLKKGDYLDVINLAAMIIIRTEMYGDDA